MIWATPKINNSYETEQRIREYEHVYAEHGIKILFKIQLTSGIMLYITNPSDSIPMAWAFYPKTGCEDYIGCYDERWDFDKWKESCIDKLLYKHDWFNEDVMRLLESRGKRSVQRGWCYA